jgi:hypothetical protein
VRIIGAPLNAAAQRAATYMRSHHNLLTIGPETKPKVELIVNNALPRLTTGDIRVQEKKK